MRILGFLAIGVIAVSGCGGASAEAASGDSSVLGDTSVVVRRLASGTPLAALSVLPDGRTLLLIDTTGNLAVRDLASGDVRQLTTGGDWTDRWVEFGVTSPDGTQAAYTWWNVDRTDLRVVPVAGGDDRLLHSVDVDTDEMVVHDWRPDGDALLLLLQRAGEPAALAEYLLDEERIDTLRVFAQHEPGGARYSPDGLSVLYALQSTDDLRSRDLYLLSRSAEPRRVIDMPEPVAPVGWTGDGDALLFTSLHDGLARLWRQPLGGGEPVGEPQLVRGDLLGFHSLHTRDGRAYFHTFGREIALRYVTLAPATLEATSPPTLFAEIDDAFVLRLAWSPDGEHVAYTVSPFGGEIPRHIVIRSRASGQERRFARARRLGNSLVWNSDGLFVRENDDVLRLDFSSGAFVPAPPIPMLMGWGLGSVSADGSMSAWVRRRAEVQQLVVRDDRTGAERVLHEAPSIGTRRISPDGRWVAVLAGDDGRVVVHPTDGGKERELFVPPASSWTKRGSIAWSPDSRHVLVVMQHVQDDSMTSEFWKVDLDGNASHVLTAGGPGGAIGFALSADGRQLVYVSGKDERPGELWVVEGM